MFNRVQSIQYPNNGIIKKKNSWTNHIFISAEAGSGDENEAIYDKIKNSTGNQRAMCPHMRFVCVEFQYNSTPTANSEPSTMIVAGRDIQRPRPTFGP